MSRRIDANNRLDKGHKELDDALAAHHTATDELPAQEANRG
jgi:hypothetical protein